MSARILLVLALAGCATRKYDPEGLAKAPTWVASLSHETVDTKVAGPVVGPLRIVPPTVCASECETTLNRLVGALEDRGVTLSPEATTKLVFREVRHQKQADVAPMAMDLYTVDGDTRTPFQVDEALGNACTAAAKEHGTVKAEQLTLVASVQDETGERASWNFSSSEPMGLDLVYRSARQPDKYGFLPPPKNYNSGTQRLGAALAISGSMLGTIGIAMNRSLGGNWTKAGRDFTKAAIVGVPTMIGGFYLIGKGNKEVIANPAPIPTEPGFWKPVNDVFCAGKPTAIEPIVASAPAAAEPAPEPEPEPEPSGQSSFSLTAPAPVPVAEAPADSSLIDRAAEHFMSTVWEASS